MTDENTTIKFFDNEYYIGEFLFHHEIEYSDISEFVSFGNNIKNPKKSVSCNDSFFAIIKLKNEKKNLVFINVVVGLDIPNNRVECVSISICKPCDSHIKTLVENDVKLAISEIKLNELLEKSFIDSKNLILEETLAEIVEIQENINAVHLMK